MFDNVRKIHGCLHENMMPLYGMIKSIKTDLIRKSKKKDFPIDFVVTWVDGNDPTWKNEKSKYECVSEGEGNINARFRDWELLVYWFRAIEKYAPWVHNVYFVTYGHIPSWLNEKCSKLRIIRHSDYIPEQFLPTFSSIPIELNLWRIPELSEHFVYFNDDTYLARPVMPEDFFENGLPKYVAIAEPLINYGTYAFFQHQLFSNLGIINKKFNIKECIDKNMDKWFSYCYRKEYKYNLLTYQKSHLFGMHFTHLACPYRKSTFKKVWLEIPERMEWSCHHKFRDPLDIMHQIFQLWEICEGSFFPVPRYYYGSAPIGVNDKVLEAITEEKYRCVCLNDSECISNEEFEMLKKECKKVFEKKFPGKSIFEK